MSAALNNHQKKTSPTSKMPPITHVCPDEEPEISSTHSQQAYCISNQKAKTFVSLYLNWEAEQRCIHWPLKRLVSCMSHVNLNQELDQHCRVVIWGYARLLCGLPSAQLKGSFQLAAFHPADRSKKGAAALKANLQFCVIFCSLMLICCVPEQTNNNNKKPQYSFQT